jgi:hypothetical protein
MVDIGIYTSRVTLDHKLEQLDDGKGPEATWNMGRLPKNLGKEEGPDRIFFAVGGRWRGYFNLSRDVLYNPDDDEKPYSLLFEIASWTKIKPVPVKRFRGFRYLDGIPQGDDSQ